MFLIILSLANNHKLYARPRIYRKKLYIVRPLHQNHAHASNLMTAKFHSVDWGEAREMWLFSLMYQNSNTTAQSIKTEATKNKNRKMMAKNLCVFYEFWRRIQLLYVWWIYLPELAIIRQFNLLLRLIDCSTNLNFDVICLIELRSQNLLKSEEATDTAHQTAAHKINNVKVPIKIWMFLNLSICVFIASHCSQIR